MSKAKSKKHKQFIKTPRLIGGNEGFRNHIEQNLIYPTEALANKIEGTVFLTYEVNDDGEVFNINIEKGIGFGCNEEATRLISMLKFEKVKNIGVRLKKKLKARIKFSLPGIKINYSYKEESDTIKYNYTLPAKKD